MEWEWEMGDMLLLPSIPSLIAKWYVKYNRYERPFAIDLFIMILNTGTVH